MPALLINNEIYGDTPFDKQQKIINVINQASKSWVMPTDIQVTHYGVGEVGNKEFSDAGEYYLDVVSGNVYVSDTTMVEEITTPSGDVVGEKTTYIWDLDRTLTSVQSEIDALNSNLDKLVFRKITVTLVNGVATYTMNGVTSSSIIAAILNQNNNMYVMQTLCSENTVTIKSNVTTENGMVSCILIGRL